MKFQIVLGFAAQALAVVVNSGADRTTVTDPVSTRSFTLPPFPSPFPSPIPSRDTSERSSDPVFIPPAAPNPTDVQIVGLVYGGTGCPSNTVSSILSDDRTIMTLIFDQYVAQIGPGVAVTENRKNCQLNIDLRYPGGFQYSVFSADYRGYAYLDKGVTGMQKSIYYFSGQTAQTSTQTTWVGPMNQDYLLHDQANQTSIVWSPCGANGAMNINSQLRLTSTNATAVGELTNDSIDTSFKQIVYVSWQQCNATAA